MDTDQIYDSCFVVVAGPNGCDYVALAMLVRRDVYVSAESSLEVRVATVTEGGLIRFHDQRLGEINPPRSAVAIHFIGGNHFDAWVLRDGSYDNTASSTELNRIAEIVRQQRSAIVKRRRLQANVAAALSTVSGRNLPISQRICVPPSPPREMA